MTVVEADGERGRTDVRKRVVSEGVSRKVNEKEKPMHVFRGNMKTKE